MVGKSIKVWFLNVVLVAASFVIALIVSEFVIRLFYHPIDYLRPDVVDDAYLNFRISANAGGHDEWGFRNYTRPDQADIVAIGDSMTYGYAAHSYESWPAVVSELSEKSTYNLGMGGYGPLHYLHLLRERAIYLSPKLVIVGIYLGNDFWDAINLAYTNDNWMVYRKDNFQMSFTHSGPRQNGRGSEQKGKFLGPLRHYLSQNSVFYRMVTQSPILDGFVRTNINSLDEGKYLYSDNNFSALFQPSRNKRMLDPNDPQVPIAIDIVKTAILEMHDFSLEKKFDLYILLVPTKELVYSKVLAEKEKLNAHPDMETAIKYERLIREQLISFLEHEALPYVDPLISLQRAVEKQVIYPVSDSHPNAAGYRIIASAVMEKLEKRFTQP